MGRKRSKISKIHGFQKGYTPWNLGKKFDFSTNITFIKCERLDFNVYNEYVHEGPSGILTIHNVDGTNVENKILRPRSPIPEIVDYYLHPQVEHPNHHTNKVYMGSKVESMYVSETKNHRNHNKTCVGDLKFDCDASQKWGLGWRERLACTVCDFVSKYHGLYDEVESEKRGRKAAKLNVAAALALMQTPISNKNFREMLMVSNIIPPCSSGMQKTSNKVSKLVEEINKQSMRDIRAEIVERNKACGLTNENLVRVEGDACFNNPIHNAGTTPFQAGTQVTYCMIENNTKQKYVVSAFTGNQLCAIASRLRGKGIEVICPYHDGICTANIAEDEVIGNEKAYSRYCADEVSDYFKISHVTTDGDSRAFEGVKEIHGPNVQSLRDVRHLSGSLKRAILKCSFSSTLFQDQELEVRRVDLLWTLMQDVLQSSIRVLHFTMVNYTKSKSTCPK